MSALPVMLVEIPAKCAKILTEASAVTRSTALSDIREMTCRKGKSIVNHAIYPHV